MNNNFSFEEMVRRYSSNELKDIIAMVKEKDVTNHKYIAFLEAFFEYRLSLNQYLTIYIIGLSPGVGATSLKNILIQKKLPAEECLSPVQIIGKLEMLSSLIAERSIVLVLFDKQSQVNILDAVEWQTLFRRTNYILVSTKADTKSYKEVLELENEVWTNVCARKVIHVSINDNQLFGLPNLIKKLRE